MGGRQKKQKHRQHPPSMGRPGPGTSTGGNTNRPGAAAALRDASALTPLERSLRRLLEPSLTDEDRQAQETLLRSQLDDPWLVARSPFLPDDHPLKQQAALVCGVLEQVTAGETGEPVLAPLAQIPRRSPLAPYVLACRAIHALYAGEKEQALRLAAGIDESSPASRLARGVRALAGEPVQSHSKALRRFLAIAEAQQHLQRRLAALDELFEREDSRQAKRAVSELFRDLRSGSPRLIRRFRELVIFHWAQQGWPPEDLPAMLGLTPGTPEMLRTLAIGVEKVSPEMSAGLWMEYPDVARLEDADRALVLTHAAGLVMRAPGFCPECGVIHRMKAGAERVVERLAAEGRIDEDADLSDLMGAFFEALEEDESLLDDLGEADGPDLDPGEMLMDAIDLDPRPETFTQLVSFYERKGDRKELEAVLEQWAETFPDAAFPLIRLAAVATEKGASRKAVTYIERAAALDPLNPEVRLQKLRLLLNSALLRLKNRKFHLARQDMEAMRGLEGTADQAREALLFGLETLVAALEAGNVEKISLEAEGEDRTVSFMLLVDLSRLSGQQAVRPVMTFHMAQAALVREFSRGVIAYQDLAQPLGLPGLASGYVLDLVETHLEPKTPLDLSSAELVALAGIAVRADRPSIALRATDEVLKKPEDPLLAPALVQRGRALLDGHIRRALPCLQAGLTLARRRGDSETVRLAVQALQAPSGRRGHGHAANPALLEPLSESALAEVLRRERVEAFVAETPAPATTRGKKRGRKSTATGTA